MDNISQSKKIRIASLLGNFMRLDGGAMFGNAPKALWKRWIAPDENNMIDIGSRSLLIESDDHKILFEAGAGSYLSPAMKKRFSVLDDDHVLLNSLERKGLSHTDITHVVLSHLHFDHAGGLLKGWQEEAQNIELLFPNAQFVAGQLNVERSDSPHIRDRASFIPGLTTLLRDSERLVLKNGGDHMVLGDIQIEFFESHGHTPGMLIPIIKIHDFQMIFTADLVPGVPWVNLPITMGYDRNPELLIDEKQTVLERAYENDAFLFYTHDAMFAGSKLKIDDKTKRFIPDTPLEKIEIVLDT